ncbi:MAG: YihY/virulence factor BrkB family protein [Microcoleaceae cyanobacterium]
MNLTSLKLSVLWKLLRDAFAEWQRDRASMLAAALSYYMIFSIAPLLILVMVSLGAVVGEKMAQDEVMNQLEKLVGDQAAQAIQDIVQGQFRRNAGIQASVIAIATMVFGATNVFVQLKAALNMVWGVEPKPGRPVKGFVKARILSILMVLGIGLILLLSLTLSSVLSGMGSWLEQWLVLSKTFWSLIDFFVSIGLITLLFGQIYRLLPDVQIAWKNVSVGALITALLFTVGKSIISWYLGHSTVTSVYGAAGSLVVFLLWVFYSTQIFLFGAEFTKVWSRHQGSQIRPDKHARFTARSLDQDRL